jgi:tRNA pseudouridine13 synthase
METKSDLAPPVRSLVPSEPPFEHADLEALGGHIGPDPEDFVVDEVPLYEASGEGEHWYVRLRKRGATTPELRAAVADAAGVPEREIGYAGMKDKHAVTTQWLSVPVPRTNPPEAWQLPEAFSVLAVTRHVNKLRIGHLESNRFRIRLVNVEPSARARLAPLCERIAHAGVGNYFGSQRFGIGQRNLESALFALSRGRLGPRSGNRGKFLASVLQSEIFNRYLTARSELSRERVVLGDVVRLEGSRSLFLVENEESEQPRLVKRDIHLTGPMVGPKMKESAGRPHELERAAIASIGLTDALLDALGRSAPGTRRDLLLWPGELRHELGDDGSLSVEFTLPSGAYASLVIRCLTRQDPWLGADRELVDDQRPEHASD